MVKQAFKVAWSYQRSPMEKPSAPEGHLWYQRYLQADNLEQILPHHKVTYS